MWSADPVIQNPFNLQCYNRYSYCVNNPLRYTDPTGYNPELAMGGVAIVAAVCVGAIAYVSAPPATQAQMRDACQTAVSLAANKLSKAADNIAHTAKSVGSSTVEALSSLKPSGAGVDQYSESGNQIMTAIHAIRNYLSSGNQAASKETSAAGKQVDTAPKPEAEKAAPKDKTSGGGVSPNPDDKGKQTSTQTQTRQKPGADGGTATITTERDSDGNAISRTHTVTNDGAVVHQHQEHIGSSGSDVRLPDEWTGTKTINDTHHVDHGPRLDPEPTSPPAPPTLQPTITPTEQQKLQQQ
jgi:hypothetical protein